MDDSLGDVDGRVVNGALRGDGQLQLHAEGAYVDLPAGLLSRYENATLEFWLSWAGDRSRRYERTFEFGRTVARGSELRVESFFLLSPNYDDGVMPRLHFRGQSGEQTRVFASSAFPVATATHVVVVADRDRQRLSLYVNGREIGSSAWTQRLRELRDENVWLGRSQRPNDPPADCSFDEFRVYDVALTAAEIERSYEQGPDRLP